MTLKSPSLQAKAKKKKPANIKKSNTLKQNLLTEETLFFIYKLNIHTVQKSTIIRNLKFNGRKHII